MDRGERIPEGVEREVREETGVKAKFQAILALREQVDYLYGAADFYFVCVLKPTDSTKICIDDTDEVKKAQWIPISAITGGEKSEFQLFPNAFQFISLIKRYIENEKSQEFSLENLINNHCLSHR